MKRGTLSFSDARRLRQSPIFAFLIAALLCGILAGSFTGMHIPQSDGKYVNDLAVLLSSNAIGQMPTLRTVATCFAAAFGWAAAAVLCGAAVGRLLWIALLVAVRGFLLAFSAAAALGESGIWGIYISLTSIGVSAIFWIPAMLLLCTAVLDTGRRGYFTGLRRYSGVLAFCCVLLLGSVLWRLLAVPALMGVVGK